MATTPALLLSALALLPAGPARAAPAEVDFERHVLPILGRAGCSAGACHGSFQGKGGFRLSLFNHDPRADYRMLTRLGMGRRVDVLDPDRSLILLKPTGQVPHGGGKRFARGSWEYRVLRAWVAQGARYAPGKGEVKRIDVNPAEHVFTSSAKPLRLKVLVEFADGTRADVAPYCDFRPRDDSVAGASPGGVVRARAPGDTAVVVSYRGLLRTARVFVPARLEGAYPDVPENNFVDTEVFAKLRKLRIVPSDLADDSTFLRRVTVDTIGTLPSPDEVRAFLADTSPLKRARKVEELLAHPMHAAVWATRFCDVTGANVDVLDGPAELRAKQMKIWHDWLRKRFAENVHYDKMVEGILCATSRGGRDVGPWLRDELRLYESMGKGFTTDYADRPYLDLFWKRSGPEGPFSPRQMAELTAAAFLGVRLECAQCHKHPFDRWTQQDYRAFANVFARTRFGSSPELRAAVQDLLEKRRAHPDEAVKPLPRLSDVFVAGGTDRELPDPQTGEALAPRALGGPSLEGAGDPREKLFRWLARPDNPYLARAFVNRVWAHYFGVGLVEPVDNFSVANPPSNERLLDVLARHFVRTKYDVRALERVILLSRAYQLSFVPNKTNARDRTNYSRAYPRRPLAEVAIDMLDSALGTRGDFGADAPPGARAVEVATNRVRSGYVARVFRIFGRPERTALCDCERSAEPALPQTLFLMADPLLLKKMSGGRLKELLDSKKSDDEVVEELFLATLSRHPDADERRQARQHLKGKKDRKKAFMDLTWALINTREFILNH